MRKWNKISIATNEENLNSFLGACIQFNLMPFAWWSSIYLILEEFCISCSRGMNFWFNIFFNWSDVLPDERRIIRSDEEAVQCTLYVFNRYFPFQTIELDQKIQDGVPSAVTHRMWFTEQKSGGLILPIWSSCKVERTVNKYWNWRTISPYAATTSISQ